jgi:hypothetical protein
VYDLVEQKLLADASLSCQRLKSLLSDTADRQDTQAMRVPQVNRCILSQ